MYNWCWIVWYNFSFITFKNKNIKIDIYEKKKEILSETTLKNQHRFHLGYHYPRSKKTVSEIKSSSIDFVKFYGNKIFGKTKNIYGISKKNSKVNFNEYCKKLESYGLNKKIKKFDIFSKLIENSIITNEKILNYFKIKKIIKNKIKKSKKINLKLGKTVSNKILDDYDKIIICTYANNNKVLSKLGVKESILTKKRYELVEKIVVKMPKSLRKLSVVILDGNFLNFDPFIGTNYHLLSVVKEAKIEIVNGKFPLFKSSKKKYLKYNFIKNIKKSNFKNFINFGKKYIPSLENAKYIKSAYVVRCVNISKNNQDRKTIIKTYGNKIISVFSGKWNNCVKISKKIKNMI